MKAYLDNDVVSAIAKDDTATESAALDRLLAAKDEGKLDLVTSGITLKEIKRYKGSNRKPVERTFRLLNKVPVVEWEELVRIESYGDSRTWINAPVIQNQVLYDSLLKLGLEPTDVQHLFAAANQGCEIFLTCDGVILAHADDISQLCKLAVQKPSHLAAKLPP